MKAYWNIPLFMSRHGLFTAGLVLVLACCLAIPVGVAYADDVPQFEIEALEANYQAANQRLEEATERAAKNQAIIDKLEKELPKQQRKADKALRELYIMQENKLYYLDVVLQVETIDELLLEMEYFERASGKNLDELNKLKDMLAQLEEARKKLEAAKADADAEAEAARSALVALQEERSAKQSWGQANALSQDGSSALVDGADWYMTEDEFVAEWAPRINAYLEGSPMAGTGETFALMSFRYCVDPRWSPAIANTESGKGKKCIRPYNAWGWGAADSDPYNLASEWSSWDEAIEAHISGLANAYGYTISKHAAKSYCSTPDSWYANTLSEMALI